MVIERRKLSLLATLAALAVALLIPLVTAGNVYFLTVLIIMLIFILFSSAWNFLTYTGQGSLGHAAFFGIGGYISTLVAAGSGLSPYLTIFAGRGCCGAGWTLQSGSSVCGSRNGSCQW